MAALTCWPPRSNGRPRSGRPTRYVDREKPARSDGDGWPGSRGDLARGNLCAFGALPRAIIAGAIIRGAIGPRFISVHQWLNLPWLGISSLRDSAAPREIRGGTPRCKVLSEGR